jgi:hypothetical protein
LQYYFSQNNIENITLNWHQELIFPKQFDVYQQGIFPQYPGALRRTVNLTTDLDLAFEAPMSLPENTSGYCPPAVFLAGRQSQAKRPAC